MEYVIETYYISTKYITDSLRHIRDPTTSFGDMIATAKSSKLKRGGVANS